MVKRFVRWFGKSVHKKNMEWYNSRLECVLYAVVILALAFFFGREAFAAINTPLVPESFTLQYAEEHHNYKRKASDDYELRMHSTDGKTYIVDSDNIRRRETQDILEILQPDMQIDVLMGNDGVREVVADGQLLLSQEVTARRAMTTATLKLFFVGVLVVSDAFLWIRFAVLCIKKKKGWNF